MKRLVAISSFYTFIVSFITLPLFVAAVLLLGSRVNYLLVLVAIIALVSFLVARRVSVR